jgi:hypothetical protein
VYARMATFEGDPAQIKEVAETIGKESESGPPEGVPGKEFLLLTGRDSGKMVMSESICSRSVHAKA